MLLESANTLSYRCVFNPVGYLTLNLNLTKEPEINWNDESEDYWADIDEDCHDTSFEENPRGFKCPCCDERGDAPGCTRYKHIAKDVTAGNKRSRMD